MSRQRIRAGDVFTVPESRLLITKLLSPKCLLGLHDGTVFVSKVLKPVEIVIQRNDDFSTSIDDFTYTTFLHDGKGVSAVGSLSAHNLSELMKFAMKETLFSKPIAKCASSEDYESILEDAGGMLYGRRCKVPSPKKSSVKIVRKPVRKPAVKRQTRK